VHSEKSIGAVLAETKEELKNFIQTRLAILKAELSGKIKSWKAVIPLAVTAALVLLTTFFTITFTLVALLAGLFQPRPLAWFYGGVIVSLLYLVVGAILGLVALNRIKAVQMIPTRTLEVLKQDQLWIQKETKAA
jgi:Putative Actinobacterial Holin-X, holin superfamily III